MAAWRYGCRVRAVHLTMFYSESLDNAPSSSAAARRVVERLGGEVDEETMSCLRLLVSELVTNAVEHASGTGPVELSVRLDAGTVRVEVADHGAGFEYRPRRPGDPADSGWGLHFVAQLAQRWGTEASDGGRVWFEMPARVASRRP